MAENKSHLTLEYLQKYASGKVFVETGTYHGDTVKLALQFPDFEYIESIELNDELYNECKLMFDANKNVRIWHGDSVTILPEIIKQYPNDTLTFFLDAHASGDLKGGAFGGSPLEYELKAIKEHGNPNDTVFIDDRRLFGSSEWDFVSEKTAMDLLKEINPDYNIVLLDGHQMKDVVCATIKEVSPEDIGPKLPTTLTITPFGTKVE